MANALKSTPAKNFDGSAAGSKGDSIGELENDKKSELKKDAKNGKPANGNNQAKQTPAAQPGQQPAAPAAPSQQPAAPAANVPEPGGGVSKGRN